MGQRSYRIIAGRPILEEVHQLGQRHWPSILQIAAAIAFLGALALIAGCDADLTQRIKQAEARERFWNAAFPFEGESVYCIWRDDRLVCLHYSVVPKYSKRAPHVLERSAELSKEEVSYE